MKTKFTVHGIYKCQLEFINCTETDKKIRKKKEIKVFHCIYCKEKKRKKKTTNRKPQNKMNMKKG